MKTKQKSKLTVYAIIATLFIVAATAASSCSSISPETSYDWGYQTGKAIREIHDAR